MPSPDTLPTPIAVFFGMALLLASAASLLLRVLGFSVASRSWLIASAVVMWTPAIARWITQKSVEPSWQSPLPIRGSAAPLYLVVLVPLGVELLIYASAYAVAAGAGLIRWSPPWSGLRMGANLGLNLPLLILMGLVASAGEELGWRGYLQPRLDVAGIPYSYVVTGLLWAVFHLPVMTLLGYQRGDAPAAGFALFAVNCVADSYIWGSVSYAAGSVQPAIWFHTFHNVFAQWMFPKLFDGRSSTVWLGEAGMLPVAAHVVAALAVRWWSPAGLTLPLR